MTVNGDLSLTYHDLLRTGPGTLAGRYLRSFWQPVLRAQDLGRGEAKPIRVMSEDFAVFRGDSGEPHVVDARCAHRGAGLSIGWVEGDTIRCAYHGWKYDATGQCVDQPAEPDPFCQKIKIKAYPTKEYLGLVFAYFGEGEPPPLPHLLEYDDDEYPREVRYDVWPINYFAQLENAVDYSHTGFLHWQFDFKANGSPIVEETPYGVRIEAPGLSGGREAFNERTFFLMPNMHEWPGPPRAPETVGRFAIGWRVPLDDNSHIRLNIDSVPLKGQAAREFLERQKARRPFTRPVPETAAEIISGRNSFKNVKEQNIISGGELTQIQDCTALGSLGPIASRDHNEHLGKTDAGVILVRKIWMRELRAFARGEQLTSWKRPDSLWDDMKAMA